MTIENKGLRLALTVTVKSQCELCHTDVGVATWCLFVHCNHVYTLCIACASSDISLVDVLRECSRHD